MSPSAVQAVGAPAVEYAGVTKWFGASTALDRVDCIVERGSVHGLVGPNGAGKTTLLALLFGLVRPDEGSVRLFGGEQSQVGARWLDGVGGFLETPRFYPYLTGRRNLQVLAGLDRGDSSALVDPALDLVGLRDAADTKVRAYSLGMRQRLGIASAVLRRPRLLVLDEPTNGLDPGAVTGLRRAFGALAASGVTVLLSSHDIAQVDEVCDAVTVLHRGGAVFSGTMQRLRAEAPNPLWRMATADDAVAAGMAVTSGITLLAETADGLLRLSSSRAELDALVLRLGRAGVAVRLLDRDASALQVLMQRLTGVQLPEADRPEGPPAPAGAGVGTARRSEPAGSR